MVPGCTAAWRAITPIVTGRNELCHVMNITARSNANSYRPFNPIRRMPLPSSPHILRHAPFFACGVFLMIPPKFRQ